MKTLDQLGRSIDERTGYNPFHVGVPHMELTYSYFSTDGSQYDATLSHPGFLIGPAFKDTTVGDSTYSVAIPTVDRDHVDHYIFYAPGHTGVDGGSYPSAVQTAKEDSSTGHWASSSDYEVLHGNSTMYRGPCLTDYCRLDTTGTGWTAPNGPSDADFCHEFQHSIDQQWIPGSITEIFSSGAEAVVGESPNESPIYEVPYTWDLLQHDNYQNWRLLSAYLAYGFRGTDTTATLSGMRDDLLSRWAHTPFRQLSNLRDSLSDASCAECATKSYFHPGSVSLDDTTRFQLLLHNWRVADYVNNSFLAEGQYGFPPQFGFTPVQDVAAWLRIDGDASDDGEAIPPEVTARRAWAVRETTIVGTRVGPGGSHAMKLSRFGSEYWVVRSDTSLAHGTQELVVRLSPEGIYNRPESVTGASPTCQMVDARLLASVVPYSIPSDSLGTGLLYAHPEWAQTPLTPSWVDVDSVAGDLKFTIPAFGSTSNAAVVVLSLADGPRQAVVNHYNGFGNELPGAIFPYRVNFAVRSTPYDTLAPRLIQRRSGQTDDHPAWSPKSDSLALEATNTDSSSYQQVYLKQIASGVAGRLLPRSLNQYTPDWSPRGDWVALAQDSSSTGQTDILLVEPSVRTVRRVASGSLHKRLPAFGPDGQELVYANEVSGTPTQWQIRKVKVDGTGDVAIVQAGAAIGGLRWAPDGASVFFTRNDTLYSVPYTGGTVTVRTGLIAKSASSLDLHLGQGALLVEEPGRFRYKESCTVGDSADMPYHRLALRDTTAHDTQARFYQTGASYYNPRWAPNGVRVAYSSDINSVGDRDVFVGQVNYDHPPTWTWSGGFDVTVEEGSTYHLTLAATDPDGESITYQAPSRYLPSGSSLSSNLFTWNVPSGTAGSTYYVVFRALDPSGGLANMVMRMDVITGGGCPFVDTRTAAGWQVENSILGRSLSGTMALDGYRLKETPSVENGRVAVRIRENEQEVTTLDQVQLVAVDHDPMYRVLPLAGRPMLGTVTPAARVSTSAGQDVTSFFANGGYSASAGETLYVDMPQYAPPAASRGLERIEGGDCCFDDGGGGKGGGGLPQQGPTATAHPASIDAQILSSTGILIQAPDGADGWRTVTHQYPREYYDEALTDSIASQAHLRLIFLDTHHIGFLGRFSPGPSCTPQSCTITAAEHSRLGSVLDAISSAGGVSASLEPGDTLTLQATPPAQGEGTVRDYFLVANGVYTAALPGTLHPAGPRAVPLQFALHQNEPNPFQQTTRIRFDLPAPADVRLELFDAQGRKVRTLLSGHFEAGYQAATWDHRNGSGSPVHPGVYLYRLQAGSFRAQHKMVLLP